MKIFKIPNIFKIITTVIDINLPFQIKLLEII